MSLPSPSKEMTKYKPKKAAYALDTVHTLMAALKSNPSPGRVADALACAEKSTKLLEDELAVKRAAENTSGAVVHVSMSISEVIANFPNMKGQENKISLCTHLPGHRKSSVSDFEFTKLVQPSDLTWFKPHDDCTYYAVNRSNATWIVSAREGVKMPGPGMEPAMVFKKGGAMPEPVKTRKDSTLGKPTAAKIVRESPRYIDGLNQTRMLRNIVDTWQSQTWLSMAERELAFCWILCAKCMVNLTVPSNFWCSRDAIAFRKKFVAWASCVTVDHLTPQYLSAYMKLCATLKSFPLESPYHAPLVALNALVSSVASELSEAELEAMARVEPLPDLVEETLKAISLSRQGSEEAGGSKSRPTSADANRKVEDES